MQDPGLLVLAADQVTGALGRNASPDALEARRMQALSLGVHIPLVCFGIAFPAMFLFVHGLYLRTGAPHYKALAKRWSKVALILFAVGVVTGTILSFEFGLLWPDFMATFGDVFGLAFGLEGVSFFVEAIFIAIYVYGWDRLPERTHFLTGIPVVIAGFAGSFNVIAVNGWMNNPTGFDVVDGQVVDPAPWVALLNDNLWHELVHMYLAGYIVAGFIVAGVYAFAHLRGKRDAYHRTGLVVALSFAALAAPVQVSSATGRGGRWRRTSRSSSPRSRDCPGPTEGAPFTIGGWYDADTNELNGGIEIPKLLSLLATHDPNGTVQGLDTVAPDDRPPVNIVPLRVPHDGRDRHRPRAARRPVRASRGGASADCPARAGSTGAVMVAGPLALVALIAGWITTEVGRQPWIVYETMRVKDAVTSQRRARAGLRGRSCSSTSASPAPSCGCCGG